MFQINANAEYCLYRKYKNIKFKTVIKRNILKPMRSNYLFLDFIIIRKTNIKVINNSNKF